MIKLEDIKKSVVSLLKSQNLKVYGSEIKEGFKRPCFFVQLMPINYDIVKKGFSENLTTVEIVYFSENETDLENIKMQDTLKSIFIQPLVINSRKITCKNIRSESDDGGDTMTFNSLSFKFDLNYLDEIIDTTPEAEQAKDLILNLKGGI